MKIDNQVGAGAVADVPNNENCTEFHDDSWAAGVSLIHVDHVAIVWPEAVDAIQEACDRLGNMQMPSVLRALANGGLVDVAH